MGTGAVAFNIAPHHALLCDINPHLINFYQAVAEQDITPSGVREYLSSEGANLLKRGEAHYYHVRERFNKKFNPLDFLFLNRAGFNGMIRFNRKGHFNTPFCKKPQRFSPAYITKIVNQVAYVSHLLATKKFKFKCQSFKDTITRANTDDVIYCDPPYIDRHADYFNGWDVEQEKSLFNVLAKTNSQFILSTWHHNQYRENKYIKSLWGQFNMLTREHFYHIGASEKNRNLMIEAIVTNCEIQHGNNETNETNEMNETLKQQEQISLLI